MGRNLEPKIGYGDPAWRAACVSVRGRAHVASGERCQDAWAISRERNSLGVCLCDGAGSARLSDLGAKAVSHKVAWQLSLHGPDPTSGLDDSDVITLALEAIQEEAELHGGSPEDYACTLVGLAVRGDRAISVHIGDGLIAAVEAGLPRVLSPPDNGEFANETVFVTSRNAASRLRLKCHELSPLLTSFVLMTDGAQAALYDKKTGTVAQAAEQMASWLDEAHENKVRTALRQTLRDNIIPATGDDCTLAIVRRSVRASRFSCKICRRWDLKRDLTDERRFVLRCAACGSEVVGEPARGRRYPRIAWEWITHLAVERQFDLQAVERVTGIPERGIRRRLLMRRFLARVRREG